MGRVGYIRQGADRSALGRPVGYLALFMVLIVYGCNHNEAIYFTNFILHLCVWVCVCAYMILSVLTRVRDGRLKVFYCHRLGFKTNNSFNKMNCYVGIAIK